MLREMQQTLLHISHDLEALWDADRVIWIEQGKLQMDGKPIVVLPAYMAAMDTVGEQDAFADIAN